MRLPNDLDKKLQEESEKTGIPLTGIILFAIKDWLKEPVSYSMRLPSGQIIEIAVTVGKTDVIDK